jgi:hypothetical protein
MYQVLNNKKKTRPKPLDFSGIRKIHSMPSFGGEVKLYVPCPSFAACKKSQRKIFKIKTRWQNWGVVPAFAGRGLAHPYDAWRLW